MPPRARNALSAALIALACALVPFGALAAWVSYGLTDTGGYVRAMAPPAADPAVRDGGRERAVTVDLAPVTARVEHEPAHGDGPLVRHAPVRHTEVAVLPAEDLARLRKGYDVLDVAGFWLPVTAAALAAAGISVAACRRRAVTATALGTALGGALLGVAVAVGRHLTLADLPDPAHQPAAGAIYDALTATLRTVSWLLVALGLAVALTCRLSDRQGRRGRPLPVSLRRRASAAPAADPAPEPTRARA